MPGREYHEALWQGVPHGLQPPDFAVRSRFLLGHVTPGDRVLDVGCGEGRFAAELARAGAQVVGIDVAEEPLRRARARHPELDLRIVQGEGPWQLPDAGFELVWAGEVIEHVADTARWLSEVRRVLDRNGRLLLTTPNHSRIHLALHGVQRYSHPLGDHLHLYSRASLTEVLGEFGFDTVTVRTAGGVPGLRRLLLARAAR